ncbi:hypothetical protein PVMG_02277 [Plasmodium vivax Mauritania I]|uniref:Uncharacterized protein n=1 Tax=Plasmodium vivax Mauritania I TaxID=1035515 RepID=A0A0J9TG30_PLAVI|nr:hypothetical protein PVMG_02277 [Plasmodium vivax Mauritania I]
MEFKEVMNYNCRITMFTPQMLILTDIILHINLDKSKKSQYVLFFITTNRKDKYIINRHYAETTFMCFIKLQNTNI